jgi:hypothetical protein
MIFGRVYLLNLPAHRTKKENVSYFTVLCYIHIGKPGIQSPSPAISFMSRLCFEEKVDLWSSNSERIDLLFDA